MDEIQKMFQAIINGQSAFRQEILKEINRLDQKIDKLGAKIESLEINLTERIDKLGKQLSID